MFRWNQLLFPEQTGMNPSAGDVRVLTVHSIGYDPHAVKYNSVQTTKNAVIWKCSVMSGILIVGKGWQTIQLPERLSGQHIKLGVC